MLCMYFFSTPYSTVMTINVSSQGEPWFVRKKQIFQHTNPFLWKTHVVDLILAAKLLANTEALNLYWTTQQILDVSAADVGVGVGRSVFNACFSTVYLIFTLRLIRYTLFKTMRYCTQRLGWEIAIYSSISIRLGPLLHPPHSTTRINYSDWVSRPRLNHKQVVSGKVRLVLFPYRVVNLHSWRGNGLCDVYSQSRNEHF